MGHDKAITRQEIEKIGGVTRTWFEWELMNDGQACGLVIEVDRDTDPDTPDNFVGTLHEIERVTKRALSSMTTCLSTGCGWCQADLNACLFPVISPADFGKHPLPSDTVDNS